MIIALVYRRLWLWKNRLVPSIFLFLSLPLVVFLMISLPLKNIIRFSLGGIPYDPVSYTHLTLPTMDSV